MKSLFFSVFVVVRQASKLPMTNRFPAIGTSALRGEYPKAPRNERNVSGNGLGRLAISHESLSMICPESYPVAIGL